MYPHVRRIRYLWKNNKQNELLKKFSQDLVKVENKIKQNDTGKRVVWIATPDKYVNFYGYRSLYSAYLKKELKSIMQKAKFYSKYSKKLTVVGNSKFSPYFEVLKQNGWSLCWDTNNEILKNIAITPEGYSIGAEIEFNTRKAWILTPPTTEKAMEVLIKCAISEKEITVDSVKYEGIFLSHNSEDKPFARRLKSSLKERGVEKVWLDEAEIMVGDSLIKKNEEGINSTAYFGIVLSPRSINSSWVEHELEMAMNMEIKAKKVKVLPMVYEKCELPGFLNGKLYADFTSESSYEGSVEKLLQRLAIK